jgi:hypothetical protein
LKEHTKFKATEIEHLKFMATAIEHIKFKATKRGESARKLQKLTLCQIILLEQIL